MAKYSSEERKAFAGEKKPSMQRRCVENDYTARRMYMITMVTEGRKALFGTATRTTGPQKRAFMCQGL